MIPNSHARIMVFGTFDVIHPGHIDFFEQALALSKNPYLIVSIARDKNVKKIKGKKPLHSEHNRLKAVKKTGLANKVILGGMDNYISHIIKAKPQIIALGYDQKVYVNGLKADLKKAGLAVTIKRLKAYKPHKYKSSLIKQ